MARGTRGAYRKEDRVALPADLQKELVEKAAAKYGNCQELAKHLRIPKSSVHYYRVGRLTMPVSVLEEMLRIAGDEELRMRVSEKGVAKDRSWATEYAQDVFREMCRDRLRLPTMEELLADDNLRRKAAAIVSYVLAEGSIWLQNQGCGECAVNITFGEHESDLYDHFRNLCKEVFHHDIGPAQAPGNGAVAIRGFIYSRFVAEWLMENGVLPGEKSARELRLPRWVMESGDRETWLAALQPWCDGEGHVQHSPKSSTRSFSITQSRHSGLDICTIPKELASPIGRSISGGALSHIEIFGAPVVECCSALFRSTVLDDVAELFRRLGLRPKTVLAALRFRNDGFWSCIWTIRFDAADSLQLLRLGLVTQSRKRAILAR